MGFIGSLFLAGAVLALTSACNNTQMTGSAGTQEGKKPAASPSSDASKPDEQGKEKNPRPSAPSGPEEQIGQASDGDAPIGEDQGGTGGLDAGGGDPGDAAVGSSDVSITELLGGTLQTSTDTTSQQLSDDEVVFGGPKSFRIGDYAASATSCSQQVLPAALAGRQFFFEFEVMSDGANVTLSIEGICGVDYGDTNFIYVAHAGAAITAATPMGCGEQPRSVSAGGLKRGKYQLVVESRAGATTSCWGTVPALVDHDDFIVGRVRAKSVGASIKPGSVGAVP